MRRFRRILFQQSRTLFVLLFIGLCFAGDAARHVDWPAFSRRVLAGSYDDATVPQIVEQAPYEAVPSRPRVRDAPAPPAPRPDYHLPASDDGTLPVVSHIPTEQKVVFLTLDDGLARTADATRLLAKYNIKAPMFLNDEYVHEEPAYFKKQLQRGMTIGSHTVDHADLTTLGYDQQVAEICTNADNLEQWLGARPTLFRPPYGSYDSNTIAAAKVCGMRALVMWSAKANGGSMQYQYGNTGLMPGDIVLMHFRPEFAQDFQAFIDAAKTAGLQPANLDEWLQPTPPRPALDAAPAAQ